MGFIRKYPLTSFFALTFLIVWLGLAANISGKFPAFGQWPLSFEGHRIAVFRTRQTLLNWVPNLVAIMIVGLGGGSHQIRKLLAPFFQWKVGIRIWLLAFFLPLGMAAMAVGLHCFLGGELNLEFVKFIPLIFLFRFIFSLSTESVGGEAGWRGFALERLQQRYSPLIASMTVGVMWGLCHWPILTIRGFSPSDFVYFLITTVCLSILLTWFYNRTRGSLFIVAFFHTLMNAVDATLGRSFVAPLGKSEFLFVLMITMIVITMMVVVLTKGRLGFVSSLHYTYK